MLECNRTKTNEHNGIYSTNSLRGYDVIDAIKAQEQASAISSVELILFLHL